MMALNLVTGATGLLGSHIVERLRKRNEPVRALVRKGSDVAFLKSQNVELAEGDVTDPASLAEAFKGVTTVYHSAAKVGDWGPWSDFLSITIGGTANMIAAAKAAKVERFLHISSISAYGHPDGEGLVLDEKAPLGVGLHRWSYYSRAKVTAEGLIWDAHKNDKFPVTLVRPSWLYGIRDRASMPRLVDAVRNGKIKVIGDGRNRLNLTNASNEAEGCILAATNPKAIGEAYNLSNDGVITQEEYFQDRRGTRRRAEIQARPVRHRQVRGADDGGLWPHDRPKEAAAGDALLGLADGPAMLLQLQQGPQRARLESDHRLRRRHPPGRPLGTGAKEGGGGVTASGPRTASFARAVQWIYPRLRQSAGQVASSSHSELRSMPATAVLSQACGRERCWVTTRPRRYHRRSHGNLGLEFGFRLSSPRTDQLVVSGSELAFEECF
ncbi:MAG: NAD-dependent epimerase/dehydratase family protein [Phycisphaerae bacterium]|nr:NAD-dependent epimerase/dehydratase family protein [Phycisphaerae bacterium]